MVRMKDLYILGMNKEGIFLERSTNLGLKSWNRFLKFMAITSWQTSALLPCCKLEREQRKEGRKVGERNIKENDGGVKNNTKKKKEWGRREKRRGSSGKMEVGEQCKQRRGET